MLPEYTPWVEPPLRDAGPDPETRENSLAASHPAGLESPLLPASLPERRRPDGNRPAPRCRPPGSHPPRSAFGGTPLSRPPTPVPVADDPLARERSHLAGSRAALRAMREDAESLDIKDVTANWVNAEVLARQIGERIKSLADLSDTPLFFGRLDYLHSPGADRAEGAEGERFYIGRRHVHDHDGDPMVIDWRAPVSQPFYRASKKDPMDISCAADSATRAARSRPTRTSTSPTPPRRRPPASCSSRRSSARASARCATSSRPSSPSRTRSYGPDSAARSVYRRSRHREDRRRPAPGRVPALRPSRAARPHRHPRHRAEPVLPALHRASAARAG